MMLTPWMNLGQQGRIAVIGGSEDYTGAPYFSAMASARLGCDMVRLSLPPRLYIVYEGRIACCS